MQNDVSADPRLSGLTMRLAEFAAGVKCAQMPVQVREQAKLIARDSLDNQIAAKFQATAGLVLPEAQVATISSRVMALEDERDAGAIPPLTVALEASPKLRAV